MPLKLVDPRKGKTPNYGIRGTHLHVYVDKSSGTPKRSVARGIRDELERAIECGEYPPREAPPGREQPTFLSAAVAYLEAGRSRRYVATLIKYFGETALPDIDQQAIDLAAVALYPNVKPSTRNTYAYTPISAILHHAGVKMEIARPVGAKGAIITDFMVPEDAFGIIRGAEAFDLEFALYLKVLLYTGVRVGEPLEKMLRENVLPAESAAWLQGHTKNGDPRMLRLREDLCEELARHIAAQPTGRVFRFRQGGHLTHMLLRAKLAYLGLPCPRRRPTGWRQPPNRLTWVNLKVFRHTWASWMRRYGGLDLQGLVATRNWRDPRSAARYAHVVEREEWDRVEQLPAIGGKSVERTSRRR